MELWPPHTKAGDDTHQLLSRDWGGANSALGSSSSVGGDIYLSPTCGDNDGVVVKSVDCVD